MRHKVSGSPPLVSVLMCVHNEPVSQLKQSVRSILEQTFEEFELVLVDDGSSDKQTLDYLITVAASDARVRIVRTAGVGLTRALNEGARQCKGDYLLRHDADDWSSRERVEQQVAALSADKALALVGSNFVLCKCDGAAVLRSSLPESHESIRRSLTSRRAAFCHGATAMRRSAFVEVGGYRDQFKRTQDLDLFLRLSERYNCINLPGHLYYHRRCAGAVSIQHTREQDYYASLAYTLAAQRCRGAESMADAEVTAAAEVVSAEKLGAVALRRGDHLLIAGNYFGAVEAYMTATRNVAAWPRIALKVLRLFVWGMVPPFRGKLFRGTRGR